MIKIKDSTEIGNFIKERLEQLNMRRSDLAEELAKAKGEELYSKDQLRDLVYKWINGKRTPGIDYIYYLSKILKVSIEEILVAGNTCEKYESRPFTLYAVAKSNNCEQLDEIMKTQTPDGSIVGINYDEYDKTILDYVVEFENIEMIKYMIKKEYLKFNSYGSHITTTINIGGQCSFLEMTNKIIMLAIKYDDVELFSAIVTRETPLWRTKPLVDNDIYVRTEYQDGFELHPDILDSILCKEEILKYLTQPYIPTLENWERLNLGITYGDRHNRNYCINDNLSRIYRLPVAFNLLLDTTLNNNNDKSKKLIEIMKKHNSSVKSELKLFYDDDELYCNKFGNYKNHRGSLSILGTIQKTTFDKIKEQNTKNELQKFVGE